MGEVFFITDEETETQESYVTCPRFLWGSGAVIHIWLGFIFYLILFSSFIEI